MAEKSRRGRIDPPDLSGKGGMKDGEPQRSDRRLFMQLLAFGDCADASAAERVLDAADLQTGGYEDGNDPRGIAILTLAADPNVLLDGLRPVLTQELFAGLTPKPEYTMLGRTY